MNERTALLTPPPVGSASPPPARRDHFTARLSAQNGYAVLISIIIGSGIFASPAQVDNNVPAPGYALLVWLLGGLLAWMGAASMAELGAALPASGGIQAYLHRVYGELMAFLAAWTWIVVVQPATLAILSITFVEAISVGRTSRIYIIWHNDFAILILGAVVLLNCVGSRTSTRIGKAFIPIKLLSVAAIMAQGAVVVGLHLSGSRREAGGSDWYSKAWFSRRSNWANVGVWELFGHVSTALYGSLWAYSGWDKANFLAGEMRHPGHDLPLAIHLALITVIVCFVLANASYYVLLSWDVVGSTDAIAVMATKALLGDAAGVVAAVFVAAVVAGSINANVFVVGRLTVAAAHKNYLPRPFGYLDRVFSRPELNEGAGEAGEPDAERFGPRDNDATVIGQRCRNPNTSHVEHASHSSSSVEVRGPEASQVPLNAYILNVVITSGYILAGDFRSLLVLDGIIEYTFFFFAVLGAVILRRRERTLHRPYKSPIIITCLFCLVSAAVVFRGAIYATTQTCILLVIELLGACLFWAGGLSQRDGVP